MAESFYSSVPPLAWGGCEMYNPHADYEKLLEDNGIFAVMPLPHLVQLEPPKYIEPPGHVYHVSCEELEAMMNWDHILRPIVAPLVPSADPVVPAAHAMPASASDSPCHTSASEAESGKRCTPEPSKRTRGSRKRSESSLTDAPSPVSPTPKRRRSSSKNSQFVPVVKSKRARALELMMKRDNHNDSERQRRCEMKDGLNSLKSALPSMKGMSRMNTSQLLEYAISYIREVVDEEQRLVAEKESLRLENERLQLMAAI